MLIFCQPKRLYISLYLENKTNVLLMVFMVYLLALTKMNVWQYQDQFQGHTRVEKGKMHEFFYK